LPSNVIAFLSRDEALAIHSTLLERFGGPAGVRDYGLLESALYRPQTGHYADLAEMAAALFESLIMNHPFLFLSGLLENDCCSFDLLLPWIRKHAATNQELPAMEMLEVCPAAILILTMRS